MKVCPICNQTYNDEAQNYCLNDGSTLNKINDKEPPPVFMNPTRTTGQNNWATNEAADVRQNQPLQSNQSFPPLAVQGQNQTLPTVSLILGVLGLVLMCCYGGLPFGIGAVVTGYLGLSNANRDSTQYGGRGLAIAGLILGGIALFGSLLILIFAAIGKH